MPERVCLSIPIFKSGETHHWGIYFDGWHPSLWDLPFQGVPIFLCLFFRWVTPISIRFCPFRACLFFMLFFDVWHPSLRDFAFQGDQRTPWKSTIAQHRASSYETPSVCNIKSYFYQQTAHRTRQSTALLTFKSLFSNLYYFTFKNNFDKSFTIGV